jgi:hypothetical protein
MSSLDLWTRIICWLGWCVGVLRLCLFVFVCVCLVYLPPPLFHRWLLFICLMTTPPFFLLFGCLFHHPLFLISDHVQLFLKLLKVVYSLTSYSRCVVVLWPQCWAVFGWPPLSQSPPSPHPSSTLWPPGSVVWGKKIPRTNKAALFKDLTVG